jgi:hypothetical protein
VHGQVGALEEVLPEQGVLGQLGALVPRQGLAQVLGQGLDRGQEAVADSDRAVALGQVDQHRVPGLPLHQGGDG